MRKPMPQMVDRKCKGCGAPFLARAADVKRGWGLYCSKSCKATKQEQRTGQMKHYLQTGAPLNRREQDEIDHEEAMDDAFSGWDEGGWLSDDSGCSPSH